MFFKGRAVGYEKYCHSKREFCVGLHDHYFFSLQCKRLWCWLFLCSWCLPTSMPWTRTSGVTLSNGTYKKRATPLPRHQPKHHSWLYRQKQTRLKTCASSTLILLAAGGRHEFELRVGIELCSFIIHSNELYLLGHKQASQYYCRYHYLFFSSIF